MVYPLHMYITFLCIKCAVMTHCDSCFCRNYFVIQVASSSSAINFNICVLLSFMGCVDAPPVTLHFPHGMTVILSIFPVMLTPSMMEQFFHASDELFRLGLSIQ